MKCGNCGTEIMFASKFCFKCGADLESETAQSETEKRDDTTPPPLKSSVKKTASDGESKQNNNKEKQNSSSDEGTWKKANNYVERHYNLFFIGTMTIMLTVLTIWAFATAK